MSSSRQWRLAGVSLAVLLAANLHALCDGAEEPELEGLNGEERKYAILYWDYTVADRVIHPTSANQMGAKGSGAEAGGLRTGYRFFVPHFERLSGLAYVGHGARMRLALERASSGEALHIGVLGGSISCGVAARGFSGTYAALFTEWLNEAMPPSYTVDRRSTSARRLALEHMQPWEEGQQRQEEEEEDWEAAEAVLKAASELSSQSGNLLLGAHDQASAAEGADTRADVRRRGRAVLADEAEDSDGDESDLESEGGSGDADAKEGEQGPRHVLHSGAIPGTVSAYMSSCMQYHIPLDKVDIVFVEYAVNDNYRPATDYEREDRHAYERLLRKLMNLPQRPAVVMVQMYAAKANANQFWKNAERDFNELALYYSIPAVSLKGTVMPAALSTNPPKELQLGAVFNGGNAHPGQGGHVVVAELLITLSMELLRADHHLTHVVRHTLHEGHSGQKRTSRHRSLLKSSNSKTTKLPRSASRAIKSASVRRAAEARGNDDASVAMLGVLERAVSRPLPPPLAPDNWETGSTTCYLMEQLEAMAVRPVSAGWNWTDEGRNKWGWVALEAKQAIRFKLSTAIPNVKSKAPILLQLSYLQSYRDMGTVKVTCESGCDCDSKVIDAWDARQVSISVMANMEVSQHKDCVLQVVTQGPATGSKTQPCPQDPTKSCRGSKFKIMGFVVGEEPGGKSGSVSWVRTTTFEIAKDV